MYVYVCVHVLCTCVVYMCCVHVLCMFVYVCCVRVYMYVYCELQIVQNSG